MRSRIESHIVLSQRRWISGRGPCPHLFVASRPPICKRSRRNKGGPYLGERLGDDHDQRCYMQDLSLDFIWTSYYQDTTSSWRANQPAGADIPVDHRNVHRYIDRVLDVMLAEGVRIPVTAFREGFSLMFPLQSWPDPKIVR